MAAITNAIPVISRGVGICPSTMAAITVALAGNIVSMSAKLARGSRAIAS